MAWSRIVKAALSARTGFDVEWLEAYFGQSANPFADMAE